MANQPSTLKQALVNARRAIAAADSAIARSAAFSAKFRRDIKRIEDDYARDQRAIDKDIDCIVDEMDAETIRLIAELEREGTIET